MKNQIETTYQVPAGVEIVIKRPNGKVETIMHPTLKQITENQFKQIQRDTKNAGRGDVISYTNIQETKAKVIELSEADQAVMSSEAVKNAMTLNGRSK